MSILDKKNIWIGLAEIRALNEEGQQILKGSKIGFVNVLALARNRSEFRRITKSELEKINLVLKRLEEAELFSLRIKKFKVDNNIKSISKNIDENNPIGFGIFYVVKN